MNTNSVIDSTVEQSASTMLYYNSQTERCNEQVTTALSRSRRQKLHSCPKRFFLEQILGRNCKQTVAATVHILMTSSQSAVTASPQIM